VSVLVDSEMDSAKGASSNLLLDDVLIDAMLRSAIILTIRVFGSSV